MINQDDSQLLSSQEAPFCGTERLWFIDKPLFNIF